MPGLQVAEHDLEPVGGHGPAETEPDGDIQPVDDVVAERAGVPAARWLPVVVDVLGDAANELNRVWYA